ncbi:hypothetical protein D9615_006922 [Tricholomella constricta]|uniref:F-box domain-containing protein n=1 Tax=Tricholomella constricta TaxID=117010 RepID=A0A8H5M2W7_9AGAR|nr:hypothetical protein D9615_006922 [Tricholomella constricta]
MPANHSAVSTVVWARLPTELTREIILYLAATDIKTARILRLVSRYTNVWVLPLLFRTLTFTSPDHITRFATTLLPKRKLHIPALKSNLHTIPRPLSSYSIESLALVVNTRLPSVETALANVAPAFARLKNLVITGQNLSANAHWLRQHPIHPKNMMILHFGAPHLVNYKEPLFQRVTHLYTSTLAGHRNSFVTDLPRLTHLAVHTRLQHASEYMPVIADALLRLLEMTPQLQLFVFVLNSYDPQDEKLKEWMRVLRRCLRDKRFIALPYFRHPRMEWDRILKGKDSVWDRALAWRAMQQRGNLSEAARYTAELLKELQMENVLLMERKCIVDWEIDLVQREGYVPYEGDPTERREAVMLL